MKRETRITLDEHRPGLRRLERRLMLKRGLSLGALTMLTGCNLQDGDAVDRVLWAMSRWNDRVQAWLFDPEPARAHLSCQRHHQAVPLQRVLPGGRRTGNRWRRLRARSLRPGGRHAAAGRSGGSARCAQETQVTRHICIEGWSAIGQWSGVPFACLP